MPSSSNISWGKSAANLLKDVATITLAVTAAVGSVLFLGYITDTPITAEGTWKSISDFGGNLWQGAKNIGNFLGRHTLDILNVNHASDIPGLIGDSFKAFYSHPFGKYITWGTGGALGLYTAAKVIDSVSSPSHPPSPPPAQPLVAAPQRQPGPNELRELARRLRAAQANEQRGV